MGSFAGYVRVSRVGDRSETLISPQLQEREIRSWAKARGFDLEMLPAELDRSGADDSRPILKGAIERIERGELEGVIVWNFARFTRSLASSIAFLELIERAGGQLLLDQRADRPRPRRRADDAQLPLLDRAGRARAESGRLRQGQGRRRKARRLDGAGRPLRLPQERGTALEPDPIEGPVRAEVIRRRGAGHSWRTLAEYIRAETGTLFPARSGAADGPQPHRARRGQPG